MVMVLVMALVELVEAGLAVVEIIELLGGLILGGITIGGILSLIYL